MYFNINLAELANIALVKELFSIQKYSYFSTKTYVVGTH